MTRAPLAELGRASSVVCLLVLGSILAQFSAASGQGNIPNWGFVLSGERQFFMIASVYLLYTTASNRAKPHTVYVLHLWRHVESMLHASEFAARIHVRESGVATIQTVL